MVYVAQPEQKRENLVDSEEEEDEGGANMTAMRGKPKDPSLDF